MAVVAAMMFNNLAGAEEKESTFSGSLDVGFYGQYVDELSGGTLFNKSVIQPSLTISHKSGAYLNFWGSDGLKGGSDSRELDVSLGIAKEIGKLKIDGGYSYVNLQNLRNTKGDLHAFYLYVDGPVVLGITPFVMTELDIPVDREILEGGFLYRIGGKGSVKIAEQAIDVSLSVGGHDGAYGTRPELVSYGRCTLSTEISVGKLSITPEVSYQHRLGYAAEDGGMIEKKDKVWGGINLSYAF